MRFAWRRLVRRPIVLLLMVVSLGVGVGVNMTLYAVVKRAVFSDSQSIRDADRLLTVTPGLSYLDYADVQSQSTVAEYTIFQSASLLWAHENGTRTLGAKIVSADYFEVLGIRPVLGQTFAPDPTNPDQLLLSYQFWERTLHSDVGIVGRPMTINGWPMTIVGVLPADFYSAVAPLLAPAIYAPISPHVNVALDVRGAAQFDAVARLRSGSTMAQAVAELRVIDDHLRQTYPDIRRGQRLAAFPRSSPFQGASDGGRRFGLLALLGVVGLLGLLIMLIACANVAGVLAARTDERRKELAIRTALGASHGRLTLELFMEGLLLGVMSVAGAIALWRVSVALLPRLPGMANFGAILMPPPPPVAFAVGLTLIVAAACALGPVLLARHIHPIDGLRIGPGGARAGRLRIPRLLVGVQVAVCAVFIVAAAFIARTNVSLSRIAPGLDLTHNAVVSVRFPSTFGDRATLELERALRSIGDVSDVTYGSLPAAFNAGRNTVRLDASGEADIHVEALRVEPGFLKTLGIRLERGRTLQLGDISPNTRILPVVADRTFVDRYTRGRDPIGMTMTLAANTESGAGEQRLMIVGITAAVNLAGPTGTPAPLIFIPADPPQRSATLLVRTTSTATTAVSSIIRVLDARFPGASASVTSLADQFDAALVPIRIVTAVLAMLALIGTFVAMIGLHGLVSYEASRRTFDIGVHRALGASTRSVMSLVLRDAAVMVTGGALIGVLLMAAASQALPPLAGYVLGPIDFAATIGLLTMTTLLSCLGSVRAACQVEASVALRTE